MLSATSHIGLEFLTKFLNMSKLQNRLILLYQSLPLQTNVTGNDFRMGISVRVLEIIMKVGGNFEEHAKVQSISTRIKFQDFIPIF